jgi:hypothetical protein
VNDLNAVRDAIGASFRRFNVGEGQYLPFQSLQSDRASWTKEMRDFTEATLTTLVAEGHIKVTPRPATGWTLMRRWW